MINNHSQMKKAIASGRKFVILWNKYHEDFAGQIRVPNKVQTNAVYSVVDGDPDHKVSRYNGGLGSYMPYGKASEWSFNNGECTWHNRNGEAIFAFRFI